MNYHVTRNGETLGELPESEILARLGNGTLSPGDLGWREGMSGWEPLHALFPYHVGPGVMAAAAAQAVDRSGLVPAGRWIRLAATMLNGFFLVVAMVPFFIGLAKMEALDEVFGEGSESDVSQLDAVEPSTAVVVLIVAGVLLLIALLVVQLVFMTTRGQSLGKMMCGIRVVDERGQVPGFAKMVMLREVLPNIIGALPMVGGIFGLVDACFIFRDDRRCIHDLMASTYVVEGRPRR